jgi:MoaA/NifB/PqqE/SkfB family radical SAM enzyme
MSCNYDCKGCYSRGRPESDELSASELDRLFDEAQRLGVGAVVVTGGEPLLHDGLLDTVTRHRRLLFVIISNGSLMTAECAHRIAASGNVIALVSIEGFDFDTDSRRKSGAHKAALRALVLLRDAGACFGFAAMSTAANFEHVTSNAFISEMETLGCALGYITEYVPCGDAPRMDWRITDDMRTALRKRVMEVRTGIVLVQFPQDEYGSDNRCTAAGKYSLHISSTGDVEPCPFVAIACENVRQGGLMAAFRSPFLEAIRERPELLSRRELACSLFEHRAEVMALAREFAAGSRAPRG